MKTQNLKILIYLLLFFGSKSSNSQSLIISGKFLDQELMRTSANYTLVCDKIILVTGRDEELAAELQLNKNYKLIVGSNFKNTQTIFFSTATFIANTFNFDFELIINTDENEKSSTTAKQLFVSFNPKKQVFDYNRIMITKN
ncbi:MAG: hypothetical protein JNJ41_13500 [Bacteroidia bacterium]|nr:hypothetical protein [Bacteroidia bacterium]